MKMGSRGRVVESHYVFARHVIGEMFVLSDYGIMFVVSATNGVDNPLRTLEEDQIESRHDQPDTIVYRDSISLQYVLSHVIAVITVPSLSYLQAQSLRTSRRLLDA